MHFVFNGIQNAAGVMNLLGRDILELQGIHNQKCVILNLLSILLDLLQLALFVLGQVLRTGEQIPDNRKCFYLFIGDTFH